MAELRLHSWLVQIRVEEELRWRCLLLGFNMEVCGWDSVLEPPVDTGGTAALVVSQPVRIRTATPQLVCGSNTALPEEAATKPRHDFIHKCKINVNKTLNSIKFMNRTHQIIRV